MSISGLRLKDSRIKAGYNLRELSQITGISKATLSRYENNGLENVTLDKIRLLANTLKVSDEWLLGHDSEKESVNEVYNFIKYMELTNNNGIKNIIQVTDKNLNKLNDIDYIKNKLMLLNANGILFVKNFIDFILSQKQFLSEDNDDILLNYLNIIKSSSNNLDDNEIKTFIYKTFDSHTSDED
ncbi:MAG: helix-turn-helix domain-containing protein [Longibaculum sp.]